MKVFDNQDRMYLGERERELTYGFNEYNTMQRVIKGMSFIIKKEKKYNGKNLFP